MILCPESGFLLPYPPFLHSFKTPNRTPTQRDDALLSSSASPP